MVCLRTQSQTPILILEYAASRKENEEFRPGELLEQNHIKIERSQLYSTVLNLVDKGLLKQRQDPQDRRAVLCAITEQGAKCLECYRYRLRQFSDPEKIPYDLLPADCILAAE